MDSIAAYPSSQMWDIKKDVSLGSKRVRVRAGETYSIEFNRFIGPHQPEISTDESRIWKFMAQYNKGEDLTEIICDSEAPYLVLAAFAQGKLTRFEAATLLYYHQSNLDLGPLTVRRLLNEDGLTTQGETILRDYFRHISIIPVPTRDEDQTIQLLAENLKTRNAKAVTGYQLKQLSRHPCNLSLDVEAVFLEIVSNGYHKSSLDPRLGIFSPEDVVKTVKSWARPCHVPYPGIKSPATVHGKKSLPTNVINHDRFHLHVMYLFHRQFISAVLDLVSVFQRETGYEMSKEVWEQGDMGSDAMIARMREVYASSRTVSTTQQFDWLYQPSQKLQWFSFDQFFQLGQNASPFGWIALLHMNKQWQETHVIDLDQIKWLQPMRAILDQVGMYIRGQPILKQAYILQQLSGHKSITEREILSLLRELDGSKVVAVKIKTKTGEENNQMRLRVVTVTPRRRIDCKMFWLACQRVFTTSIQRIRRVYPS